MLSDFILLALSIIILWLITVSIFLGKMITHYNKLCEGIKEKNFKFIMENLLKDVSLAKKDIENLKSYCDKIQ
jgi:hypothetical protein